MNRSHIFACICFFHAGWLFSKPEGFLLKEGEACPPVQVEDGALLIESGKNACIHWDSFSIDRGEIVRFQQEDATSSVLNRVVGAASSSLLGDLQSNGSVYLVNPNGILIGEEATIQTAGFIASTLDLNASDFVLSFQGESAAEVINYGKIHSKAGDVFLIGKRVENHGEITAPQGRVGCLSGWSILIHPEKAPEVAIRSREEAPSEILEKNPYALAICQAGSITAKKVYLESAEGLTEMKGEITSPGGEVRVLGEIVHLLDTAKIDATGINGGGEVLIGGDYQGNNPNVRNARCTWAGPGTEIRANAIEEGNGGRVILWGDASLETFGRVEVRGGNLGGDGGFVEISSHGNLDCRGFFADRLAPLGKPGTLLLDPYNVTISTSATANESFGAGTYTPTNTGANISTTDLQSFLSGGSVVVSTTGAGAESGSITVSNSITWSANTELFLQATSYIAVNASITNMSIAGLGFSTILYAGGVGAGNNSGIYIAPGVAITTNAAVFLYGLTSSSASGGGVAGVRVDGSITTGIGNINVAGKAPSGVSLARGVLLNGPLVSGSGQIFVSGVGEGSAGHGVEIAATWSAVTTGRVTFGFGLTAPVGVGSIEGCIAGSGLANGAGLRVAAPFSTGGNVTATNMIIGGGFFGSGFFCDSSFTAAGSIDLTATTQGTPGQSNGITLTGSLRSSSGGTVTLHGTGSSSASNGYGVSISGSVGSVSDTGSISITGIGGGITDGLLDYGISLTGSVITGGTGTISLTGTGGPPASVNHGISLSGVSALVQSANGTITLAGTGSFSGTGVSLAGGAQIVSTGTGNLVIGGDGASGGSGTGIQINASEVQAATGTIALTGRTGTGAASSGAYGVYLNSGGSITSTGPLANITVAGTSRLSSGLTSRGILFESGTIETGAGNVTLTGTVPASLSVDAIVFAPGEITSTSGNITITGTGPTVSGNGIGAYFASGTTTLSTTGTVEFLDCQGGGDDYSGVLVEGGAALLASGDILFTDCIGRPGTSSSHGVVILGSASTTGGNITGTGIAASGSSSIAFLLNGTLTTSGLNKNIDITAQSSHGTGANHGISISGTLNTTGGGGITLNGTGGVSSTASYGISFSGSSAVSTTGSGAISLTGIGSGSAANYGINLAGSSVGMITSASGTITLSGTSGADATGSYGVSVTNAWTSMTTALVSISGTGGSGGASHGINIGNTLTNAGPISLTGTAGGGAGSFAHSLGGNLSTSGGVITITGTNLLTASSVTLNTTVSGSANILFSGATSTIDASSAGSQALTLTAGASGTVTLGANVGATTRLGALTLSSGTSGLTIGADVASIVANSVTVPSATTTTIQSTSTLVINTSAFGGDIQFGGPIGGGSSKDLTLNAGAGSISLASISSLGDVLLSNAAGVTASGSITATTLTQNAGTGSFQAMTLTGALSLTGSAFTLNNTVSAASATIANSGLLTIGSDVEVTLTGNFSQTGLGNVQTAGSVTTSGGDITIGKPVVLAGNASFIGTSGSISFADVLNASAMGNSYALTVEGADVTFLGAVGGTTPFASIAVTGNPIALSYNQIVSAGPMTYRGPIQLGGNVQIVNGGSGLVSFLDLPPDPLEEVGVAFDSVLGNFNFTVTANQAEVLVEGNIDLRGDAGAPFTAGGSLYILGDLGISLEGEVLTQGEENNAGAGAAGGNVFLVASNGSISFHNINSSGGDGTLLGGSAGSITVQPSNGTSGNYPEGLIVINQDLSSGLDGNLVANGGSGLTSGAGASIILSANRSSASKVATITSSLAGNDITIQCSNLILGNFEALTALGSITFDCPIVSVGDVVALNNLDFSSVVLASIYTHGNIEILDNEGSLYISPAAHFVSGGTYTSPTSMAPSGMLNEENPTLSSSLLLFDGHILNYDALGIAMSSSSSRGSSAEHAIYLLAVADAQLSDSLPIYKDFFNKPVRLRKRKYEKR